MQSASVTSRITCGTTISAGTWCAGDVHHRCRHPDIGTGCCHRPSRRSGTSARPVDPIAEQRLLVGAQRERQVLHRDVERLVLLEAGVHPVRVLVRVSPDLGVFFVSSPETLRGSRCPPRTCRRSWCSRSAADVRLDRRHPPAAIVHCCQPSERALFGVPPRIATSPLSTPVLEGVREALAERAEVADHGQVVLTGV